MLFLGWLTAFPRYLRCFLAFSLFFLSIFPGVDALKHTLSLRRRRRLFAADAATMRPRVLFNGKDEWLVAHPAAGCARFREIFERGHAASWAHLNEAQRGVLALQR